MNISENTPEDEEYAHEAVGPELDDGELLQPETRGPNYDRRLAVVAGFALIVTGVLQIRDGDVLSGVSVAGLGATASLGGRLIEMQEES